MNFFSNKSESSADINDNELNTEENNTKLNASKENNTQITVKSKSTIKNKQRKKCKRQKHRSSDKKAVLMYLYPFISNISKNYITRLSILRNHLGQLFIEDGRTATFNDIDSKLNNIIGKQQFPTVYLGSTIKFSKSTYTKTIEKFLHKFGLDKELLYPSARNTKRMEQLKALINKILRKKESII